MSEEFKVTLPKLGESILSATVVQWFKKTGERIERDEPLLEVSTDKVNSEIPSPVSGFVKEIVAPVDRELNVGDILALISTHGEDKARPAPMKQAVQQASLHTESSGAKRDFFSPALMRLAREKGIALSELERISGSGDEGRITKKDLEEYIEKKAGGCKYATPPASSENVERVKMSSMRKAIADNMVRSFYEAPHATLITEVDVTDLLKVIQNEKESFLSKNGAKLTITSFVARAMARALQEYPLINSSLDKDTILLKRFVNLGIAVSVEQGVMVPVIKNCEKMPLSRLSVAIQELSQKARSGKLSAEDINEGTITLTNFGMTGVMIGIPIIRYPEVAIVGMGAIHKKVVALEDDSFGVRSTMHLSLTFDHRVLDGIYGCGFLNALQKHIEKDLEL